MLWKFYKYHGAGNDFLLADNRDGLLSLTSGQIRHLCDRHIGFGADGVMLLERSDTLDFKMVFYNPDGSSGMMCGNGGRCIVAFASFLGVVSGNFPVEFEAADDIHTAVILDPGTIRLKMGDVQGVVDYPDDQACFLETGTRHFVKFVSGLESMDIVSEGRKLRSDPRFMPEGTNVDFVQVAGEGNLLVRTFEKGVEDETLACGTGIVASAVAAYSKGIQGTPVGGGRISYSVRAAIAGLKVEFIPGGSSDCLLASDVWLQGPVAYVGSVECLL